MTQRLDPAREQVNWRNEYLLRRPGLLSKTLNWWHRRAAARLHRKVERELRAIAMNAFYGDLYDRDV